MARSRKVTPPRFPDDMLQRLEVFGRYELDPSGSGINGEITTACVVPFTDVIYADDAEQEGFLRDLHAVVAADQGGFATYGAARLAWELFSERALRLPSGLRLVDAGIRFKLSRGLAPIHCLTGYELRRFGDWLDQPRDAPAG